MSALNFAGGVGAGLMQGSQYIRQARQDESTERYRNQALASQASRLKMEEGLYGLKMDEAKQVKAEQERVDTLGKLRLGIEENYQDRPEYEREEMFFTNGLKLGFIKPEELNASKTAYEGMVKRFGVDAFDDAVLRGDPSKMQKLFRDQGLGELGYDPQAQRFTIPTPQGTQPLDRRALMQMRVLAGVAEREQAHQKATREAGKTDAETDEKVSKAELNRATAAGKNQYTLDQNGNQVPNPLYTGGKKSGEFDPVGFQHDYAKAHGVQADMEGGGYPPWVAAGAEIHQRLLDNNRKPSGEPYSNSEQQAMVRLSRVIAQGGEGVSLDPVFGADGNIGLQATVGRQKHILEQNISLDEVGQITDSQGKPILADEKAIKEFTIRAMQGLETERPTVFEHARAIANDPDLFARVTEAAQTDPRARQALRTADLVRRGAAYAAEAAGAAGAGAGAGAGRPITAEQRELAAALGLDAPPPAGSGLLEAGADLAGDLMGGVKSVARTALGANEYQLAWRIDEEIERFHRAKSPSTRKYHATRLYEMAKNHPALIKKVKVAVEQPEGHR